MRPDGTRIKGLSPFVEVIPYIMPKRYDAQNMITEYVNEDIIRNYINAKRKEGVSISHMSLLMAAYYKAVLLHPDINNFVINRRIFRRNHFCVTFVILKKLPDGTSDETSLKIFLEPSDNLLKIHNRIQREIELNTTEDHANSTDKFAKVMMSMPGLPRAIVAFAGFLDRHGWLPRKIIDLSPFHTSLFITNLASIKTSHIYHHCYDFGTTSVFVCIGKPVPNFFKGKYDEKLLPLGVVMDERICTGLEYASFCTTLRKILSHPEELEQNFDGSVDAEPEQPVPEENVEDPVLAAMDADDFDAPAPETGSMTLL